MSYCTLEEAWGPDFKKKKKSRKEKKIELEEIKRKELIDSNIIIPKMADKRRSYNQEIINNPDLSNITAYDKYSDGYGVPYNSETNNNIQVKDILKNNKLLEQTYNKPKLVSNLEENAKEEIEKMITIPEKKYYELMNHVEGFTNNVDNQFNQLILYIFAGIFYLLLLDMMYQLGKKSY